MGAVVARVFTQRTHLWTGHSTLPFAVHTLALRARIGAAQPDTLLVASYRTMTQGNTDDL